MARDAELREALEKIRRTVQRAESAGDADGTEAMKRVTALAEAAVNVSYKAWVPEVQTSFSGAVMVKRRHVEVLEDAVLRLAEVVE